MKVCMILIYEGEGNSWQECEAAIEKARKKGTLAKLENSEVWAKDSLDTIEDAIENRHE